MKKLNIVVLAAAAMAVLGCDNKTAEGPPSVRLGDSVCASCNMIISDERWATSTIVDGSRGPEPRLFDDFNCQVDFETKHTDLKILARWSHCHLTQDWIHTEQAFFLVSPELRTPMGSGLAAFEESANAEAAAVNLGASVMKFDKAWILLATGLVAD
jgi:copper chaperone NosL